MIQSTQQTDSTRNLFIKVSDVVEKVLEYLSIIIAAVLCINMVISVFARYVFTKPIFWADELSLILFVWISFLGAALGLKKWEMPAVTLIVDKLGPKLFLIFNLFIQVSIIIFCITIGVYSYEWILSPSVINMISPTLRISMAYVYMILPLIIVIMALFSIEHIYKSIINFKKR